MVLIKRLQYFQISASRSYTCINYLLVLKKAVAIETIMALTAHKI